MLCKECEHFNKCKNQPISMLSETLSNMEDICPDASFDSPGYLILTEEWREFYLRNPARFIERYLGIKLTLFQRMIITLTFWKRGNKK